MAKIRLNYRDATHRYIPKLQSWVEKDSSWQMQMELPAEYDTSSGTAIFELLLAPDPVIISAQPLHTSSDFESELLQREILGKEFVQIEKAGTSKKGRPIWQLDITEVEENNPAPVIALIGRQHPPEVTGYLASLLFLEELTADNELAKQFRETFVVKAFPMLNPDGVDMGHWRHNAGGVDLNRDWKNFNQPETQTVRDRLIGVQNNPLRTLFYAIDFHSTNENIFYPIKKEVSTRPDNITQKWVKMIVADNPDLSFSVEEFDTSSPIAKNWFYREFGIDAVTYEVNDQISDEMLKEVSRSAARNLMKLLLEEAENIP